MFQRGKDVHQPGRKLSNQFGDPLAGRRTSIGSTGSGVGLEKTESIEEPGAQRRRRVSFVYHHWRYCVSMEWRRESRTLFLQPSSSSSLVHFPSSESFSSPPIFHAYEPTSPWPTTNRPSHPQSSAANRGLFENLSTHKRGSQDYTERRASYTEMAGNGPPGLVSGWFNKTFKGVEKPASSTAAMGNDGKMMSAEQKKMEERRGVME
jgi:hypothetical protein